jgi:4-diphosphocytidyl-2-C-methyl-D-erythritol kinase
VDNLTIQSCAKLNLYLEVLNKRADNYHNIKTLFERISLFDTLILKKRRDKSIKILCSDPLVPADSSNLCYRAAKLIQRGFKKTGGIEIRIIKRIPVGAGLAGGSSNAASVLWALNKIWRLRLKKERLLRYARKIGADVAFFLYNTPFALGKGRGDEIKPLKLQQVSSFWHILVVPRIIVSTPLAYKQWDIHKNFKLTLPFLSSKTLGKNKRAGLTKPRHDVNILISALKKRDLSLMGIGLFNSLGEASEKMYPEIGRVKMRLSDLGLKSILVSGSGPAVFGIVSSRKEALALSRKIKRQDESWRVFVTRTI